MKPTTALLTAVSMAVVLAACNQKTDKAVDSAVNQTEATTTNLGDAAANAIGNAVDALTPTPTGQEFADKAARSDAFEVAAAKLALDNAASPKVKSFARTMIAAHTASTAKIEAAAAKATAAITPDPAMTAAEKDQLADLSKLSGGAFDRQYLSGQVDAHEEALSLMQDYAKHGEVEPLKAVAKEIAPVVQKHLDMAKALTG